MTVGIAYSPTWTSKQKKGPKRKSMSMETLLSKHFKAYAMTKAATEGLPMLRGT
ncbi:hypothetical protein KVR01_009929 [Diaporthe batatas]|uniref:uncharacterized protein n=1 Tax=Diaporthe batatas TaxID=748121 RepID=UPI001D048AA3|nr:uncharacterized protein KVR01_009929 [Diaporthe batatas]KAG8160393.1 hypothetical protein KVR01_009929 [Diaporthe batatas]